jgi:putative heme degradation protein
MRRSALEFMGAEARLKVEPGAFDAWLAASAQSGAPMMLVLAAPD